ncbi:MAG: alpha-mannosidase [Promethearchaeota archaeon]
MKEIVIVPETHWDREWYLPFQEYRAKLVDLVDRLLEILDADERFKNFTLDGQTVVLEDYLEVRPHRKEELQAYIAEGRISVGPMYVLPDEFLVSGEALIRNLMLGHKIAKKFGRVMKAGYIPDPFGHVAQIPQILAGFGVNSILFARGFGNEYEEQKLQMEFLWNSPGRAASVLGVYLVEGYGSVASLSTVKDGSGRYASALNRIERVVAKLSEHATTDTVLLNNGSDHLLPQPELPDLIEQWNAEHPDAPLVNSDFEDYVARVISKHPKLREFTGELRGGRYRPILTGVLSTRMWIKQWNFACQTNFEKYSEPASALAWLVSPNFEYPQDYLWLGWRWLIKNHPHDSICGCSVDEVHEEMRARFAWAEGIGNEALKDALVAVASEMVTRPGAGDEFIDLVVFNPHPWEVTAPVTFEVYLDADEPACPEDFVLQDPDGNVIDLQDQQVQVKPRYLNAGNHAYEFRFVAAGLPPFGLRKYYLYPAERAPDREPVVTRTENTLENEFYRVEFAPDGSFSLTDKETGVAFSNLGVLVDEGDWGDEYDFSWPNKPESQKVLKSTDEGVEVQIEGGLSGVTAASTKIKYDLLLPAGLSPDRESRSTDLVECPVEMEVFLHAGVKRVDLKLIVVNNAEDHRLRIHFPSGIEADVVQADGHFVVLDRDVSLPDDTGWNQKVQGTNHQNAFVNVQDGRAGLAVFNRGLPEYEAVRGEGGKITLAVTLLRCVGWLSRGDMASRNGNAGPDLCTPGGQCLGASSFELSVFTHAGDWQSAGALEGAQVFTAPPLAAFPGSITSRTRARDKVFFSGISILSGQPIESSGRLPEDFSFMRLTGEGLVCSTVKRSENGAGLVVRLVNFRPETTNGALQFAFKPAAVVLVDFNEEDTPITETIKANFELVDGLVNLALGPHVVVTLKVLFPV